MCVYIYIPVYVPYVYMYVCVCVYTPIEHVQKQTHIHTF